MLKKKKSMPLREERVLDTSLYSSSRFPEAVGNDTLGKI